MRGYAVVFSCFTVLAAALIFLAARSPADQANFPIELEFKNFRPDGELQIEEVVSRPSRDVLVTDRKLYGRSPDYERRVDDYKTRTMFRVNDPLRMVAAYRLDSNAPLKLTYADPKRKCMASLTGQTIPGEKFLGRDEILGEKVVVIERPINAGGGSIKLYRAPHLDCAVLKADMGGYTSEVARISRRVPPNRGRIPEDYETVTDTEYARRSLKHRFPAKSDAEVAAKAQEMAARDRDINISTFQIPAHLQMDCCKQ